MSKPGDVFLRIDEDRMSFVDAVPDDADGIVCMKFSVPLILPDNVVAVCVSCSCIVQLRPVAAAHPAPKVCVDCAVAWAEGLENPQ